MKTFSFFFFFGEHLRFVSLVLGLGLEHSCPWPRECLSSERLSLALALASDFFCVLGLGLGLEPCVLDSTSDALNHFLINSNAKTVSEELKTRYFSYSAFWLTGQWRGLQPPTAQAALLIELQVTNKKKSRFLLVWVLYFFNLQVNC